VEMNEEVSMAEGSGDGMGDGDGDRSSDEHAGKKAKVEKEDAD